jgi:uncharacterized protein YtpQ (UPF0354 family)
MRRALQLLLLLSVVCSSCSKSDVLAPGPFSKEFAAALQTASPGLKVELVQDLQLKITTVDGKDFTFFLDNAYGLYNQDPKSKDAVIRKYVESGLDTFTHPATDTVDRARIVPVLKDRGWLQEIRWAVADRSDQKMPENVYEDFTDDLIIVYAEDSPKNIRYLTPTNLVTLQLERKELRALACENLKRVIPAVQREENDGFCQLSVGGDYDISLLLLDSVWDQIKPDIKGDIVVALPARDSLLVSGSENGRGIANVKELVKKIYGESPYHLSSKLLVRRNGKFEEFKN